jgi:alpha-1,2-glucosyltransferase
MVFLLSYGILRILQLRNNPGQRLHEAEDITGKDPPAKDPTFVLDVHSALNIALFPPLLFFSALYYTDVMSTLAVLLAYIAYLTKSKKSSSIVGNISAVVVGLIALLFRQTNIFWVAVFPAGLAVVDALKATSPSATERSRDITSVMQNSWRESTIHDCSVQDAGLQGT